ncbi:MAG: TIGR02221 family CRISPR-associated protein [Candidatus Marinimicrobia bacterium]|nr:TIGR02221 family CRISPR-associated protein [Candidatus Neomarinimicrobiota bacterium]
MMTNKKNILVSVIGKPFDGEYKQAKYEFEQGKIEETNFFFLPLVKIYDIDTLYLLGTKDSIWEKIPKDIPYEKVLIPQGKTGGDQWEIFNTINKLSLDNSNVYFDFTHGFRTMPFISLLSIFYFKSTMPKVTVKKVLYGNYEGRDPNTQVCPVVDLSGFLQIFDWLFAVKSFTKFGNGEQLCDLLSKYSETNIKRLRDSIHNINSAMQLGYTTTLPMQFESMNAAYGHIDTDSIPAISPLKTIMPELSKLTSLIDFSRPDYEKQLTIANWYYKNNLIVNSIISLRETYVTFIGETGNFAFSNYSERKNIAKKALNNKKLLIRFKLEKLYELWVRVIRIRNNVGHPYFDTTSSEEISDKNRIGNLLGESKKLFIELSNSYEMKNLFKEIRKKKLLETRKEFTADELISKYNN